MPSYNTRFELGLQDIDMIEGALRRRKADLSVERLTGETRGDTARIDDELAGIHELLGKLHNQKVFYRPKTGDAPYVGG